MELILVRHGETAMNVSGVYCGWSDSCLTDKGLLHAKEASVKLKTEKLDIIISSDLSRTVKTADIIGEFHKADRIQMNTLREIHFGLWEGLSYNDISETYPKESELWKTDWMAYSPPEGESLLQMYNRVTNAVLAVINKHEDETILIVTHGGCIRAILAFLIGRGIEDFWKYKISNGLITRVEIHDGFSVLTALNV